MEVFQGGDYQMRKVFLEGALELDEAVFEFVRWAFQIVGQVWYVQVL